MKRTLLEELQHYDGAVVAALKDIENQVATVWQYIPLAAKEILRLQSHIDKLEEELRNAKNRD